MKKIEIEKDVPLPSSGITIKIEKGIPLPSAGSNPRTEMGKIMKDLKVGESFCTDVNVNTIHSHARYYGARIVFRKLGGGEYRVWRIK